MDFALNIGGYRIVLHEPNDHPSLAWPIRPFESFLAPPVPTPDIHVVVNVASPLPDLPTSRIRFDSDHGQWKLFNSPSGLVIESLSPSTLQPRARALLSEDYRTVRAWVLPDLQNGQVGWAPMQLFNPIIEVCLLSRLALDGGLLLHASGLSYQEQGLVFTGASGAGKSTMAGIFSARGARVLSDERVILRSRGSSLTVFGTPWIGSGEFAANAFATLTRLYCISHGRKRHSIEPMGPAQLIPQVLQQSFLPYWDRRGMETTLDFLVSLTTKIACSRLAFLNQPDIVDALNARSHEMVTTSS